MRFLLIGFVVLLQPVASSQPGPGTSSGEASNPLNPERRICIDCVICGANQHMTGVWGPNPDYSEYPDGQHSCPEGWGTCLEHGICGGKDEEDSAAQPSLSSELEAVRQALASGDAEVLSDVLRTASPRVKLSTERSAIQVSGCGGEIVAHFPLPAGTLQALTHPSH
jgi:hypothetical protein